MMKAMKIRIDRVLRPGFCELDREAHLESGDKLKSMLLQKRMLASW